MNYGLYLSASGVLTNLYRQDVFANNLANVETVGFKPDVPATSQRAAEAVEDNLGYQASHDLLDRLGGGVFAGPQRINFTPGSLHPTDNNLDAALADKQSFFTVEHVDPATGDVSTRLTRDGRFGLNEQGELITQTGHRVLNRQGLPIRDGDGAELAIGKHGGVIANNQLVDQLGIVRLSDTSVLQRHSQNLFSMPDGAAYDMPAEPDVKYGFIESSGSDPVMSLMNMIDATKAAMGNARMIQYHDLLMDRAVNTLGRVA